MNSPLASTPSIASRMRGKSGSYWAFTSTSGIGRTAAKSSSSPDQPIRGEYEDEGDRRVVRVPEVVVEGLVAAPDSPADSGNREAPDGRADQRERGVAPQPHAEDPGRDRDEGAHDRRQPSEQHREVVPAVEPPLRPLQLVGAE